VAANDPASIYLLAHYYKYGKAGFQQDQTKAIESWSRAAELGYSKAHNIMGSIYHEGGNLKKAKFHFEAGAMAGNELARHNVGLLEYKSGNMERAVKHWTIAASAGFFDAMYNLLIALKKGNVSRESVDSTLEAYNNSCANMKSKDRDACLQVMMERQRN
jgi:TPR repeat protein